VIKVHIFYSLSKFIILVVRCGTWVCLKQIFILMFYQSFCGTVQNDTGHLTSKLEIQIAFKNKECVASVCELVMSLI